VSGSVTEEQLCEAHEIQTKAKRAKQQGTVWKRQKSVLVRGEGADYNGDTFYTNDFLSGPSLSSGIHKWTILVVEEGPHIQMGVASYRKYRQQEAGGWSYGNDGTAGYKGSTITKEHPTFQKGSKVTFTLDLTGDGTLSATVDDGPTVTIFSNMLLAFGDGDAIGFVPTAHLLRPAILRFLGYE
jgi:hypothetical protein